MAALYLAGGGAAVPSGFCQLSFVSKGSSLSSATVEMLPGYPVCWLVYQCHPAQGTLAILFLLPGGAEQR